ncbi:MAG: NHL repeat-containing protein [Pyrinomonadaceae bacterium]|nr:NHL repeat-containing protein [Pyrinomonadaceae bacterium]
MRKAHPFFLLVVLLATTTLIPNCSRPTPTPFNWRAHVSTLAGDGSPAGFSDPFGIAIGRDGAIYVADAGENNAIRKLTTQGTLITLAGGNHVFNTPSGLAIDTDGNIYVADTSNNRIRKITIAGVVSTVAGTGVAGYLDGPANAAQFDGPIGVAVDARGNIYVADTYNDRIRKISSEGQVSTIAGAGRPGYADGESTTALFDTPCALVVSVDGTLYVADTGNNQVRQITTTGKVTTLPVSFSAEPNRSSLRSPTGLSLTHDGFLYVTELDRGTIIQIAPDGKACVIAGNGSGYADGLGDAARFNKPTGVAIDPRNGDLVVADAANYLVRRLSHSEAHAEVGTTTAPTEILPRLTPETLGEEGLLWPFDPQDRPHEVVATMGEVRGRFDSTDSRDHLHSGLDVSGTFGEVVRAIRSDKVTSPMPNWGFDSLSEGLRVGIISYIHMYVGRDKEGKPFDDPRFVRVNSDDGKLARIRVRRGSRFRPGDALGTVNRMYHVHLIVGPSGAEINPLSLSPVGFSDKIAPTIEKDGIQLFDESGNRFSEKQNGRLLVRGRVRIVVDAFDRTDMNSERRRLGLYRLGYQLFKSNDEGAVAGASGPAAKLEPAADFTVPRITIIFNRLPQSDEAPKLAYASDSGITVYGSKTTRFLYEVTNIIRDGSGTAGVWDTTSLPKGNYLLRIFAADCSGNEAQQGRDLLIAIK